jgi:hypothetical protein
MVMRVVSSWVNAERFLVAVVTVRTQTSSIVHCSEEDGARRVSRRLESSR